MTLDEAINIIKSECYVFNPLNFDRSTKINTALDVAIKALDQEPCEDVMVIHTKGLDEEIRCAMCTNSMKSNRGCDGGCVVNECMYREVMNTIENHIVPPVIPTRKKGKWINKSHTSDCGIKFVASECTCCGKKTFFDCDQLVYNYCPNCGAEMEGEKESK